MKPSHPQMPRGFTLVELTVVLVIVALLIGGLLLPLSAQQDIKNLASAEKQLAEIRDALTGYAIINGRLPCPMNDTAGIAIGSPAYGNDGRSGPDGVGGTADDDPTACTRDGILPWKTLGVGETDPWGQKRTANGDPYNGYWRYRVHPAFGAAFNAGTGTGATPISIFSPGTAILQHTTDEYPVLVVYSAGPDGAPNGRNVLTNAVTDRDYDASARTQTFDDPVMWISRPGLFSRMAAAGKLAP